MQLTPFGTLWLPLLLVVAVAARPWLPALLIFSTVFQASSVLDVPLGQGAYGVSPYNLTALLTCAVLLVRLWRTPRLDFLSTAPRAGTLLLSAYVLIAVLGAFVLPHWFAGVPVHLLLDPGGFDRPAVGLHFTVSNLAQAANLGVHACVLLFMLQAASRPEWRLERLLWGLGAAVAAVVLIGLYERLAHLGGWASFNAFWMSNPGYSQLGNHEVAGILRIVAPFSEASYASAFLAAIWSGLLALALLGRAGRWWPLAALPIVGLALLNPLGSTGWAAAGIASAVIVLIASIRALRDASLRRRVIGVWAACAVAGAALLLAPHVSPAGQKVSELVSTALLNKLESGSARSRTRSNEHAVAVARQTYGLGAGLGSNRASSYFASLLSNTGVAGLAAFAGMLIALAAGLARAARSNDTARFVLAALGTATLAVGLAIPDLNLPLYWAFIALALLTLREASRQTDR